MIIKAHNEQEKARKADIYSQATLTASCVLLGLDGKDFPDIHDVYPTLFKQEYQKEEEKVDIAEQNRIALIREQLLDYAAAANKQRNDRKVKNDT